MFGVRGRDGGGPATDEEHTWRGDQNEERNKNKDAIYKWR